MKSQRMAHGTGLKRGDIAHDALLEQAHEVGHLAGVQQRMDHLPVSLVQADEQDFPIFGRGRSRG